MPNWCSLSKDFDKKHYLKNSIIQSSQLKMLLIILLTDYFKIHLRIILY